MHFHFVLAIIFSYNLMGHAALIRWKRDGDVLGKVGNMLGGLINGIIRQSSTDQNNQDKRGLVDSHGKLNFCNSNPSQCQYLLCLAENFQHSPQADTLRQGSKVLFDRDMRQALEHDPMISKIACDKVGLNELGCKGFRQFLGLIDMIDPNKGDPMRPTTEGPSGNGPNIGNILSGGQGLIGSLIEGSGDGSGTGILPVAPVEPPATPSPVPPPITGLPAPLEGSGIAPDSTPATAPIPTSVSISTQSPTVTSQTITQVIIPASTPAPTPSPTPAPVPAPTPTLSPALTPAPAPVPTPTLAPGPTTSVISRPTSVPVQPVSTPPPAPSPNSQPIASITGTGNVLEVPAAVGVSANGPRVRLIRDAPPVQAPHAGSGSHRLPDYSDYYDGGEHRGSGAGSGGGKHRPDYTAFYGGAGAGASGSGAHVDETGYKRRDCHKEFIGVSVGSGHTPF